MINSSHIPDTIRIERDGYQKIYEATEAEKRHIARRDAVNVWALRRTQRKLDNLREELKELKEKHQHLVAESLVNPSSPHGEPQSQIHDGDFSSREARQPSQAEVVSESSPENQPIPDFKGLPCPISFGSNSSWQLPSNRSYEALWAVKSKM